MAIAAIATGWQIGADRTIGDLLANDPAGQPQLGDGWASKRGAGNVGQLWDDIVAWLQARFLRNDAGDTLAEDSYMPTPTVVASGGANFQLELVPGQTNANNRIHVTGVGSVTFILPGAPGIGTILITTESTVQGLAFSTAPTRDNGSDAPGTPRVCAVERTSSGETIVQRDTA